MTQQQKDLARIALDAALSVRHSLNIKISEPICVYDAADRLGIEVRFIDIPSLEAMYQRTPDPIILISSLRSMGRQTFSCAHEIGHHIFDHGVRVDEMQNKSLKQSPKTPEERLADLFAGFLLMPKFTVTRAFIARGWNVQLCTPLQVYTVAGWLGVGYTTLISHLQLSLNLITPSHAAELLKFTPKSIRVTLLGRNSGEGLTIVDEHWSGRAIDIQKDDLILLPNGINSEGKCIELLNADEKISLYRAVAPGHGRFLDPNTTWAAYVRVSRRSYVGRSIFRHLEDPDDDK
jgi:hypothetical protein